MITDAIILMLAVYDLLKGTNLAFTILIRFQRLLDFVKTSFYHDPRTLAHKILSRPIILYPENTLPWSKTIIGLQKILSKPTTPDHGF